MPTLIPSQCRRRVFNGKRNSDDGHGVRCQRHVHADRLRLVSRFPEGRRRRRFIQSWEALAAPGGSLTPSSGWWPVSPTRSPLALVGDGCDRTATTSIRRRRWKLHLRPIGRSLLSSVLGGDGAVVTPAQYSG
jgi:hypothetical protein